MRRRLIAANNFWNSEDKEDKVRDWEVFQLGGPTALQVRRFITPSWRVIIAGEDLLLAREESGNASPFRMHIDFCLSAFKSISFVLFLTQRHLPQIWESLHETVQLKKCRLETFEHFPTELFIHNYLSTTSDIDLP